MTPRDSGAHGFQKPAKIKISKPLINGIMKVPTKLMPIILKDCKFRFEQMPSTKLMCGRQHTLTHWASKETSLFFRATHNKIQRCIEMTH